MAEWRLGQTAAPAAQTPAAHQPARRVLVIAVLCIVSGAAGGGAVFGGLAISGQLHAPAPSQAQRVQTQVPDVPAMLAALQPSVVSIEVERLQTGPDGEPVSGRGAGSGFVIDRGGLIATNAHVVAGARQVQVTLNDGTVLPGTVAGIAADEDLAVLRVARSGLVQVRFGTSGGLRVGEIVVAVGNALALKGSPTASLGIVSALEREIEIGGGATYRHLIQTDAAINSGDSGGPLVDAGGRVVGINTAAASTAENIGFAIAIDQAAPILRQLSS